MLTEDGVIFVSIDDNELHNLIQIMNEVFGDENAIGVITVQLNPRGRHLDRFLAKTHEYIVVYARDITQQPLGQFEKDERMLGEYNREDAKGRYRELGLRNRNPAFNKVTRPRLYYPIFADTHTGEVSLKRDEVYTEEILPVDSRGVESCWTWGERKFTESNELLLARQIGNGEWRVFRKDYLLSEDGNTATTLPKSLWIDKTITNDYGKKTVKKLFGDNVFDFPKSPELIKKLITLGCGSGDIVLDFFAGSGTTAHAVMAHNAEDGGNRQFVLVQLPEETGRTDYPTISALTAERIRRAGKKIADEQAGKLPDPDAAPLDLGFCFYRFAPSNYRAWQDFEGGDLRQLELAFDQSVTPLINDWQPENLLTEVMLHLGFPLDSRIETLTAFTTNTVQRVSSEFHEHSLYACFDAAVVDETIAALALGTEDIFVCLDSALTDQSKARLSDVCNLRTI
jgi:adenine-specific DNA-methyltransferase